MTSRTKSSPPKILDISGKINIVKKAPNKGCNASTRKEHSFTAPNCVQVYEHKGKKGKLHTCYYCQRKFFVAD